MGHGDNADDLVSHFFNVASITNSTNYIKIIFDENKTKNLKSAFRFLRNKLKSADFGLEVTIVNWISQR